MIKDSIDFVIPQFTMRIPYLRKHVEVLVKSIHKYVKGIDYKIYIVYNYVDDTIELSESDGKNELEVLMELFGDDDKVIPIKGIDQTSTSGMNKGVLDPSAKGSSFRGKDGCIHAANSKYHSEALTIGIKSGNSKYVCLLDADTCFLNEWVEDIVPLADKYFYISNSWQPGTMFKEANLSFEEGRGVAVFMFIKRENFEKNNLYPNIDYRSTAGNITYFAQKNSLDFLILKNNFWSKKHCNRWSIPYEKMNSFRYDKEYLKFEDFGDGYEEAWINNKCIIVHMLSHGRFGKKENNTWTDKMEDYLNNN